MYVFTGCAKGGAVKHGLAIALQMEACGEDLSISYALKIGEDRESPHLPVVNCATKGEVA